MAQPHTRPPKLTPEQAARLDAEGEVDVTLRKAPWYQPVLEHAVKILWVLVCAMGLFILNGYNETQNKQANAAESLASAMSGLQIELVKQRGQLESLADSMRTLSSRQDSAIATAERAMAEQSSLRSRVELLQYYLLELDAKAIAAGIKPASQAISTQMLKQESKK
jgi:hypothetical protein